MIVNQQALRVIRIVTTRDVFLQEIRKEIINDKPTQQLKEHDNAVERNEIIEYHELAYVLRNLRNKVMQQEHDALTSRHFEVDKTMRRLTKNYY